MSEELVNKFQLVTQQIFNNWTALQLAVEHNMGGPTSSQIAIDAMEWVCSYCLDQSNLQIEDLTTILEDILDEEFSTMCEDDSPREVAHHLVRFLQYLKEGNLVTFDSELNKLPTCNKLLSKAQEPDPKPVKINTNMESSMEESTSTSNNQEMDIDSEWTTVHNKRNKHRS